MKKEKEIKANKESLSRKLAKYTDLAFSSSKGFQIEINSERNAYKTATVYNVKKIEKCSETSVVLITEAETISIEGKNLECITYASFALEISGIISSIIFTVGGK